MTSVLKSVKNESILFPAPDWAQDAVFYQIFPDRFARSAMYQSDGIFDVWGARPTTTNLCGGNLIGITERLEYLRDLGINALYLCPIFASNSNHRYHTYDYFKIDPVLGDDSCFDQFLNRAHALGMRVILDGVFNHCSRGFFQFNSVLELGEDSPYKNWFHIRNYPLNAYSGKPNYACWWNMPALPKFNTNNPEVREFLFSVAAYWIERGIDGWRLDVPNEINDDSFWQEFRRRVKKINPEAYIVGEIWDNPKRWLQGDQFDGVMNYPVRRLLLDFFLPKDFQPKNAASIETFCTSLNAYFAENSFSVPMNLLASHDTRRLISQPGGNLLISQILTAILFFLPGTPCTYYGEELAMEGSKDPDNRRCFPWGKFLPEKNTNYFHYYKNLIELRNKEKALRRGRFSAYAIPGGFAIRRASDYSENQEPTGDVLELRVLFGEEAVALCKNLPENFVSKCGLPCLGGKPGAEIGFVFTKNGRTF